MYKMFVLSMPQLVPSLVTTFGTYLLYISNILFHELWIGTYSTVEKSGYDFEMESAVELRIYCSSLVRQPFLSGVNKILNSGSDRFVVRGVGKKRINRGSFTKQVFQGSAT